MIAHLKGTVTDCSREAAVIDVGGVGYRVLASLRDLDRLEIGSDSFVHILTYVREDQLTLFGFIEPLSREVFGKLIGISGVGPKMALSILSTLSLDELRDAALTGNTAALKRIPGVGPKTAQRLALELEHLLTTIHIPVTTTPAASGSVKPSAAKSLRDVRSALINLQFTESAIDGAITALKSEGVDDQTHLDELIRRALSLLRSR